MSKYGKNISKPDRKISIAQAIVSAVQKYPIRSKNEYCFLAEYFLQKFRIDFIPSSVRRIFALLVEDGIIRKTDRGTYALGMRWEKYAMPEKPKNLFELAS